MTRARLAMVDADGVKIRLQSVQVLGSEFPSWGAGVDKFRSCGTCTVPSRGWRTVLGSQVVKFPVDRVAVYTQSSENLDLGSAKLVDYASCIMRLNAQVRCVSKPNFRDTMTRTGKIPLAMRVVWQTQTKAIRIFFVAGTELCDFGITPSFSQAVFIEVPLTAVIGDGSVQHIRTIVVDLSVKRRPNWDTGHHTFLQLSSTKRTSKP